MRIAAGPVDESDKENIPLFLTVVALSVFMTTLTGSMVSVILPVIRTELGGTAAQLGWIVTGYGLAYAIGVPLYGRASDLFGVRQVFSIGLLGFVLGGLICAVAPNLPLLVVGRTVQGIGGAAVPALASVAVAKVMPPGRRGAALGLTGSSVGVGSSFGPILGGVGEGIVGWRALFVGSLVLMGIIIPFAWRVLPRTRVAEATGFDLPGGILLGLGAGSFLFAITQGQSMGFGSWVVLGSFVLAGLAAALFWWRINHSADPFVAPTLFRNRGYLAATVIGFCTMLASLSVYICISLLVVDVNRLDSVTAGLILTPQAIVMALLSPLAGRVSDRVGVRLPITIGLGIVVLSLIGISVQAGDAPGWIALGMAGLGLGFAFIQSPNNNAAANALATSTLGGGMGLFVGASFLGGAAGPALFGAFLAARQNLGSGTINPFANLVAAPYSDTFLAMALAPLVAIVAARWLQQPTQRHSAR